MKEIPIKLVASGQKYATKHGFNAIRDGIKAGPASTTIKKPSWLRINIAADPKYKNVQNIVKKHQLSTVCEEAKCPNINECWSHGTATIMLMGDVCTRACKFCSVDTGNPKGWLDPNESENTAKSVSLMQLQYVVLTSVDRDDLADGGALHYAKAIRAIKKLCPKTKVEALTPDFKGDENAILTILQSGVDVFAHNVETVARLTPTVRDPRATYKQSMEVLAFAKKASPEILVKTSLMLGLGETKGEILETMQQLRDINCEILTLGQYLQPTKHHLPVAHYLEPKEFTKLRELGLNLGFREVAAGPMVRSSYRADKVFANTKQQS